MSTKKKISQNELRKLMLEQKKKTTVGSKKIESPLARYDLNGQLTCIVCESVVRSESVWTVHLNSKSHRENITRKAKRKESSVESPIPAKKPAITVPLKPAPKGILKNKVEPKYQPAQPIPEDFFDVPMKQPIVSEVEETTQTDENEKLPEGFFDDPKLDAKMRNVEYKNPVEEEWEQFQKEIKEETSKAETIISDDLEEATAGRQIDEIEEQLNHWSRVVSLEKKKQEAIPVAIPVKMEIDDDALPDEEFEEFVDWRSKKSFR